MSAKNLGAPSQSQDHYPTPPSLVVRLWEATTLPVGACWADLTFLDLGAGEGSICRTLISMGVPPQRITAIEIRPECRPALEALGVDVIIGDALTVCPERTWDVAIYNPPFTLWDDLFHAYRHRVRHLYALGRAGMGAGALERAATWREDQPDRYEVPERVTFVFVEYRSATTGELLAKSAQDAAGSCWYHWGPEERHEARVVTLRERTDAERAYRPPTRVLYVATETPEGCKRAELVREEWRA